MNPDTFTVNNSFTKSIYRDVYPAVDPRNAELSKAGKIVLVTGASRGLGRHGISFAFAHAGAKAIIITARKIEALAETEALIKKINPDVEVLKVALEVTNEDSVKAAFKTIGERYSTVDILVNNAGLFGSSDQPLASADPLAWWGDFEVNVRGTFLVTKHFLTFIGPEKKDAHLIYLSSGAGLMVIPGGSAYSITKLADLQMAAFAAAENPHLKVMAFHPGIVLTDMATEMFKPYAKDTPELSGAVINWLASEQAGFLSGRYITANWDVKEIIARKDEIVEKNLLTVGLTGLNGQVAKNLTKA
ncbi:NAD(P)-binding protein [Tothia fuscella]|uniref:NAD(P)-binding protein n=1 Tax=Tothia fuscella TaxID=1048955 RepID=A0A9P4TVB9_9PEZI|nr:NAD(P)-binding protein [Tothia fuscella]